MEAEIKLLIPTEKAFDAILDHVAGDKATQQVMQRNEFFDSERGALRAVDFSLRVRREGPMIKSRESHLYHIVVTVKGPKQRSDEGAENLSLHALVVRPEEEVVITGQVELKPGGDLLALLPPSALVSRARAALGDAALQSHESFVNVRTSVPWRFETAEAGAIDVLLELDATTFADDDRAEQQYECEVELPPARAAELAGPVAAALKTLLEEAGGEPVKPAKGKRSRCRAFLKAGRPR